MINRLEGKNKVKIVFDYIFKLNLYSEQNINKYAFVILSGKKKIENHLQMQFNNVLSINYSTFFLL